MRLCRLFLAHLANQFPARLDYYSIVVVMKPYIVHIFICVHIIMQMTIERKIDVGPSTMGGTDVAA